MKFNKILPSKRDNDIKVKIQIGMLGKSNRGFHDFNNINWD